MSQLLGQRVDWSKLISAEEWAHYRQVIECARSKGIDFVMGGGLAYSNYAPRSRNTKDLDLFILPGDRDAMVGCLHEAGFEDYHEQEAYDRSWIYRGFKEGSIVDIIWTMPNHRLVVDELWLERGSDIEIHGETLRVMPAEELIQSKLFVMQYDRCDWPDLMNILYAEGASLDWDHLMARLGPDIGLLRGLMSVYAWLSPSKAAEIPEDVWPNLGITPQWADDDEEGHRAFLLDTRDWFGPQEQDGE